MILGAFLNIAISLLIIAFVVVSALAILLVLMQRPKQEGLGAAFGGGMTDQVFGAQTTDVLQKGTNYMLWLFFIIALALSILIGKKNEGKRIEIQEEGGKAPTEEVQKEASEEPKSLSELLPNTDTDAATKPEVPETTPELAPATEPVPSVEPEGVVEEVKEAAAEAIEAIEQPVSEKVEELKNALPTLPSP